MRTILRLLAAVGMFIVAYAALRNSLGPFVDSRLAWGIFGFAPAAALALNRGTGWRTAARRAARASIGVAGVTFVGAAALIPFRCSLSPDNVGDVATCLALAPLYAVVAHTVAGMLDSLEPAADTIWHLTPRFAGVALLALLVAPAQWVAFGAATAIPLILVGARRVTPGMLAAAALFGATVVFLDTVMVDIKSFMCHGPTGRVLLAAVAAPVAVAVVAGLRRPIATVEPAA